MTDDGRGGPFHRDLRAAARVLPADPPAVGVRAAGTVARGLFSVLEQVERRRGSRIETIAVGGASVRLHRPPVADDRSPALLWIHGGGYVMGAAAQEDLLCRHLAKATGAIVAAVDYRLAPAHPFPAPLEDCYDALTWLAAHDDVDSSRIAIGGASAGGGLCAGLAIAARDRGEVDVVHQSLVYPMLDDRTVLRDLAHVPTRVWGQRANRYGWTSYLAGVPGRAGVSPLAAAARCDDLAGLAPAWIGVGTVDLFHDEDVDYARRLTEAGVPCHLEEVHGAFHGFDSIAPTAPVTRAFRASQVAALDAAFAAG